MLTKEEHGHGALQHLIDKISTEHIFYFKMTVYEGDWSDGAQTLAQPTVKNVDVNLSRECTNVHSMKLSCIMLFCSPNLQYIIICIYII